MDADRFRYLKDEAAINSVIDEEGFLHTGDLCHKVGEYYFFDGRASADCELDHWHSSLDRNCTDIEQLSKPQEDQFQSVS